MCALIQSDGSFGSAYPGLHGRSPAAAWCKRARAPAARTLRPATRRWNWNDQSVRSWTRRKRIVVRGGRGGVDESSDHFEPHVGVCMMMCDARRKTREVHTTPTCIMDVHTQTPLTLVVGPFQRVSAPRFTSRLGRKRPMTSPTCRWTTSKWTSASRTLRWASRVPKTMPSSVSQISDTSGSYDLKIL